MINREPIRYTVADTDFERVVTIIDRSQAVELIEEYYRTDTNGGGVAVTGIRYTIKAYLVAALLRIMLTESASLVGVINTIAGFTASQLAAVGMAGQEVRAIHDRRDHEYKRFHAWLSRRLAPIDPGFDLPARRITNAENRALLRARTLEQRRAAALAQERLNTVINRIVAGSIDDLSPEESCGDVVADESIFDTAALGGTLGVKPDKHRGAVASAGAYLRDERTNKVDTEHRPAKVSKSGVGLGLTALTRVGKPDALHAVPHVVIGIAILGPTSGSVEGLRIALDHARRNSLDSRTGGRARWPYLTIDMGYNPKEGFAELMLEYQYAYVARYPKHWTTVLACTNPNGGREPGPVQVNGCLYCPAAMSLARKVPLPKTRDLLLGTEAAPSDTTDSRARGAGSTGFRDYDTYLARLLPYRMGTNSRPYRGRIDHGRPRIDGPSETAIKIDVVCPAELGHVACPHKPESLEAGPVAVPLVQPTWEAHEKACCSQKTVTITLTPDQFKRQQWGWVPGSWEHTLYFEANRASTEQRFSQLKSRHVTGLSDVRTGPRREPALYLFLALAVAATNERAQRAHRTRGKHTESIARAWRRLTADLGHEPFRTPPST